MKHMSPVYTSFEWGDEDLVEGDGTGCVHVGIDGADCLVQNEQTNEADDHE